jgi:hypothetical protein
MKYYELRAMGDVIHVEAESRMDAERQVYECYGDVPEGTFRWRELSEKPQGVRFIANSNRPLG